DKRREISFWEKGQHHPDSPLSAPYDATKSSPFHLNNTDLGPKKWYWAQKSYSTQVGVNLALIRYPEVLLLYAEALNELNNGPTSDAYQSINTIRLRAGVEPYADGSMNKNDFFDVILKERRAEFTHEFQRWWTLARTKTADRFFQNTVYKA